MKYSVDRIEEDFAVCEDEDGNMKTFSLSDLPDVKEGTLFTIVDGVIEILAEETAGRRAELAQKQRNIFKKRV